MVAHGAVGGAVGQGIVGPHLGEGTRVRCTVPALEKSSGVGVEYVTVVPLDFLVAVADSRDRTTEAQLHRDLPTSDRMSVGGHPTGQAELEVLE